MAHFENRSTTTRMESCFLAVHGNPRNAKVLPWRMGHRKWCIRSRTLFETFRSLTRATLPNDPRYVVAARKIYPEPTAQSPKSAS